MSWCRKLGCTLCLIFNENPTTQKNNCIIANVIVEQVVDRNLGRDLAPLVLMVESVLVVEGSSCAISPGLTTGNFKPLLYSFVSLLKSVALNVNQVKKGWPFSSQS